jgi:phosphoribosyl 1,2-cyclic phosphodiesterase
VPPASLAGIVVSHEHGDHARGAAAFSRKWGVRLYGSRGTYAAAGFAAEGVAGYTVLAPMAPVEIGALTVKGLPVPHDAAAPYAFVVAAGRCHLGHATDLGHVTPLLADAFRSCGAVLMESNHDRELLRDGSYPPSVKDRIGGAYGHLSNDDVAAYVRRDLGECCRRLVLAHLSQANNRVDRAREAAESALWSRGLDAEVEVTDPEGTGWLDVPPGPTADSGPRQLRLW